MPLPLCHSELFLFVILSPKGEESLSDPSVALLPQDDRGEGLPQDDRDEGLPQDDKKKGSRVTG